MEGARLARHGRRGAAPPIDPAAGRSEDPGQSNGPAPQWRARVSRATGGETPPLRSSRTPIRGPRPVQWARAPRRARVSRATGGETPPSDPAAGRSEDPGQSNGRAPQEGARLARHGRRDAAPPIDPAAGRSEDPGQSNGRAPSGGRTSRAPWAARRRPSDPAAAIRPRPVQRRPEGARLARHGRRDAAPPIPAALQSEDPGPGRALPGGRALAERAARRASTPAAGCGPGQSRPRRAGRASRAHGRRDAAPPIQPHPLRGPRPVQWRAPRRARVSRATAARRRPSD